MSDKLTPSDLVTIVDCLKRELHAIHVDISGYQHRFDNPIGSDKSPKVKGLIKEEIQTLEKEATKLESVINKL